MKTFLLSALFFIASFSISPVTKASENCNSDFDCESLCCHSATKICGDHNPDENIFCGKKTGDTCIISAMCEQAPVVKCRIVKTGQRADGSQACALRCETVLTFGRCIENTCKSPLQTEMPVFDPNDCSNAQDP